MRPNQFYATTRLLTLFFLTITVACNVTLVVNHVRQINNAANVMVD